MKLPRLPLLLLAVSLAFSSALHADETPLTEQMETMGDAFKAVRRQVSDASANASTLEHLATIRSAAEKGLEFAPAYAAEKPEAERAAFIEAYQKDMHAFIAVVDELSGALKAGDNAKAEELVGQMRDAQRSGHKAYRKPKE